MIQDFISLVFPQTCLNCKEPLISGENTICTSCLFELQQLSERGLARPLINKFTAIDEVQFAESYADYSKHGIFHNMITALKYRRNEEVGRSLGRWFGTKVEKTLKEHAIELLIPVPIHPTRRRKRGYNQSDLITEGISEVTTIPWDNKIIERIKKTTTQTRKGKIDRWQNVEGIFKVVNPTVLHKRIAVIDDVVTTGATLNACIQTLVKGRSILHRGISVGNRRLTTIHEWLEHTKMFYTFVGDFQI